MVDITVRACEKCDLAGILAIEEAAYGEGSYNHYFFRQAFDLYPSLLLVACDKQNRIVGYVLGAIGEDSTKGWMMSLAVDGACAGQGIGSLLTAALLKALAQNKVNEVLLTVDPDNTAAVKVYRKFGFVEETREADYYQPNQPRVVMRLLF